LQNHRTRIHKNLFAAIGIQVVIRLSIYMDQVINPQTAATQIDHSADLPSVEWGIHATVSSSFIIPHMFRMPPNISFRNLY